MLLAISDPSPTWLRASTRVAKTQTSCMTSRQAAPALAMATYAKLALASMARLEKGALTSASQRDARVAARARHPTPVPVTAAVTSAAPLASLSGVGAAIATSRDINAPLAVLR